MNRAKRNPPGGATRRAEEERIRQPVESSQPSHYFTTRAGRRKGVVVVPIGTRASLIERSIAGLSVQQLGMWNAADCPDNHGPACYHVAASGLWIVYEQPIIPCMACGLVAHLLPVYELTGNSRAFYGPRQLTTCLSLPCSTVVYEVRLPADDLTAGREN